MLQYVYPERKYTESFKRKLPPVFLHINVSQYAQPLMIVHDENIVPENSSSKRLKIRLKILLI